MRFCPTPLSEKGQEGVQSEPYKMSSMAHFPWPKTLHGGGMRALRPLMGPVLQVSYLIMLPQVTETVAEHKRGEKANACKTNLF